MMGRRIVVGVLVVVAGLALTRAAAAQEWSGTGRVSGVVTDRAGNPVPGAKVTYRLPDAPEAGPPAFKTDKKGRYRFMGLKGGMWVVSVEAEGFLPLVTPEPTMVYAVGNNDPLRIQLEPVPEEVRQAQRRSEVNQVLKRGDELRGRGELEKAREAYTSALGELEPEEQPIVLAALADTYLQEGNVTEAKGYLERALAIDSAHVPSLVGSIVVALEEGDLDEAEALLQRLPPDQDVDPAILMRVAEAHYNRDEMEKAKTALDRTLRAHPDTVTAYYFRGLVELNLNQQEAARKDIEHFLEIAPDHPKAEEAKGFLEYLPTPAPE